jgi:hypothetical protein
MIDSKYQTSATKTVKIDRSSKKGCGYIFTFTAALLLMTAGCGGGGSTTTSRAQSSSDPYGVRVLHAAVDAAPVDLISSLKPQGQLVSQAFFAENHTDSGYRSLPQGEQTLSLTKHRSLSEAIASFNISSSSTDRYSILLYGSLQNFGLKAKLIKDELPADGNTTPHLRLVNGVSGAGGINVVSPDIGLIGLTTGQESEYLALKGPSEVSINARRSSDGAGLGSANFKAESGAVYTVLFAGEAGFYTKVLVYRDR